ncbi:hypothetical protein BDZ45DRAFT_812295 [Acephala macrosclerotiorum]|nr:hypothetical protein BDZ45DRAFT_812295 [Acephala macrosclerotiorum]
MSRDRFQELHIRVRIYGEDAKGPYAKVEPLSAYIQDVNLRVWKPGRDLAIEGMVVRFEGRAKETITVPNKPTPTGYKIWGVAQRGFLIVWNWHVPGQKNGPLGARTPRELGGTIKTGNGGNKTQAVVLHLFNRLPKPPQGSGYHVYLDNLFVSTRFVQYARSKGVAIMGTCRDTGGVIKELLELKKKDKKDIIPWGETYSIYREWRSMLYWMERLSLCFNNTFLYIR